MTATLTKPDAPMAAQLAGATDAAVGGDDAPVVRRANKLSRWWAIARYHRPQQLVLRVLTRIEQKRLKLARGGKYAKRSLETPKLRENLGWRLWLEEKLAERLEAGQRMADLASGRFEFLSQTLSLPLPIDWRLTGQSQVSHLWRFNLHYQEYLYDLARIAGGPNEADSQAAANLAWTLVEDWIDGNPLSHPGVHGDAWHPFCISRRLPAWIALWLVAPPAEPLRSKALDSFARQAWFLSKHLERDLGGNHLLENARALAMAGAFLDGKQAEDWLNAAELIFRKELAKQILPHGEHYERSPMYHALMLGAMLDVRDAVRASRPALAEYCCEVVQEMARFLEAILHPDGDIPLLGDAALGEAPPVETLLHRARIGNVQIDAAKIGDYWAYRRPGEFLLFDAGPVAPDDLPAHGHADLLGFEFSLAGRRLIVDSGVYSYADEALRQFCRSTKAHNVLQIDGVDQCDMWSRFRMGERGWPTRLEAGSAGPFEWSEATHNAYRRLGVPKVGRAIFCREGGPWIVADWTGADTHSGHRRRRLVNRLHFHPDVKLELTADDQAVVALGADRWRLAALVEGSLSIEEYPYCDRFGKQTPAACLVWTAMTVLPAASGWLVQPENGGHESAIIQRPNGFHLRWSQAESTLEWRLPMAEAHSS